MTIRDRCKVAGITVSGNLRRVPSNKKHIWVYLDEDNNMYVLNTKVDSLVVYSSDGLPTVI